LADQAEQLATLINEGISMSRELARGLQPLDDPVALPEAMQDLALQAEKLFNIECLIRVDPLPPGIDVAAATHLYRITQEAVNNAARHGNAKHVQINLQVVEADIRMVIRDDGIGFPAQRGRGLGLHTMDYRARALGGKLEIRSTPDEGTTVICTVHLQHGVSEKASHEKK
jgi:signal transduction histidine kinase